MKTAKRIQRFIERNLLTESYDGDDALADEVLDSLAIEELIAYLEERYRIAFYDEELVIENFATITVLADLVDAKRTPGRSKDAARRA